MLKRLIKYALLCLIIVVSLLLGAIAPRQLQLVEEQRESLPSIIKRVIASTVYVGCGNGSASGVIVGPSIVLTASHVVKGAFNLQIETATGKIYEAINSVADPNNDCGLIFFDPREEFKNIAELGDSNSVEIGDKVFTIGSPFGKELFNTVTFGIISGLRREIPHFGICKLITSDAAGNPGNSGGPVFNTDGKVIGIVAGRRRGTNGLTVVIPINVCKELLNEINICR